MAPSNVRLQIFYGTAKVGIGTNYFIDASERPIVMERRGPSFHASFDLFVSETTQNAFQNSCIFMEALFDPNRSAGLALLVLTDSEKWWFFDPTGGWKVSISDYTVLSGQTFTITVNGVSTVLTAGSSFAVGSSNAQAATNLANAIQGISGVYAVSQGQQVFAYSTSVSITSLSLSTSAGLFVAACFSHEYFGFNARPSIVKAGSKDDTALSRRYQVTIDLDVNKSRGDSGGGSRRDSTVQIYENESRRKTTVFEGVYTAYAATKPSALESYDLLVDNYCNGILAALGGTWEGPINPVLRLDDEYAAGAASSRRLGKVLRYSRTYDELIYNQAKGVLDDVRLRRQLLKVRPSLEAPGDYGPGGKAVFRLRRVTVSYAASVDKTQSQDLKGVYETIVKPFLVDEAIKSVGTSQIAVTFHEPTLDRAENRIEASVEVMAAGAGSLIFSTVSTMDEDDRGKFLVAVWDGGADGLGKQEYDGPRTLRRVVTQRYTIIGGPATAGGSVGGTQAGFGGKDQFGIFAINQPLSFSISAANDLEASIDNFFGIPSSSRRSGDPEPGFATSGGVPEPKNLRAVYRNGTVTIEPVVLGRPGEPQLNLVKVTKTKTYEYIRDPVRPGGGPQKDITQAFNGGNNGDPGGALKTVSR